VKEIQSKAESVLRKGATGAVTTADHCLIIPYITEKDKYICNIVGPRQFVPAYSPLVGTGPLHLKCTKRMGYALCFANSLVFGTPEGELIEQQLTKSDLARLQTSWHLSVGSVHYILRGRCTPVRFLYRARQLSAFSSSRCSFDRSDRTSQSSG
jgi:hypothetical protein